MKRLVHYQFMKPAFLSGAIFFLIANLCSAQKGPMPSASTVMSRAEVKAKKENKNILLIFHASWCPLCKKMEACLNDPSCKKMFDDNYVIAYLDVLESKDKKKLENPGGLDLLKEYRAEEAGLPFWVILDSHGMLLFDSRIRPKGTGLDVPGKNVGCPTQVDEVNFFVKVLKETSNLKDTDLSVIQELFSKNRSTGAATH